LGGEEMSKFASFADYPERTLIGAEAALLTAWGSLKRFHNDLVLVGGLAIKYRTRSERSLLPGAMTMDVDFGVALGAEGGQYGTMADDLQGQGFKRNPQGRFVRQFEDISIFIDFLTEHPKVFEGTIQVEGVSAGIFPGIERALATRTEVRVSGQDLFGAKQETTVPIAGIGALLVLKLNAFAGRQQPKDAYDVLYGVSQYTGGAERAVYEFRSEGPAGNCGYGRALRTLREYFIGPEQSGPTRCAAFALDGLAGVVDRTNRERQIVEQMVTIGRELAENG
jgi:hypothetical protein